MFQKFSLQAIFLEVLGHLPNTLHSLGFLGGSDGKESACNAGDPASIPVLGRSPGEGNGNPLHTLAWKIPWEEEPSKLVYGVANIRTR